MNDYIELRALYHHGIKGQKWGVRRYQNEDGTLTEEGLARYSKLDQKFKKNVYDVEARIATANLHNLESGRKHDDDDYVSKSVRKSAIRKKKAGEKMLKKLFDSGYMQQQYGFDSEKVNYNNFMNAVEKDVIRQYVSKYGKFRLSEFDDNGSEDYERAILKYTKRNNKGG